MHGRKIVTTGTVAMLAILVLAGGCREATTGPSSVTPKDFASNLKLLSGNAQSGVVGAALPDPLSVKVVDAGGQPVPGATVLWQVRGGGGAISPSASTSSVSGLATVTWTLGTALGANKVVAILQGTYVLDSVTFNATAMTGPANRLFKVAGDSQVAKVASRVVTPLAVNVKDQFGHTVSGVRVTWTVGSSTDSVWAVTDTTNAAGDATANWLLGTSAGAHTAFANVTGLSPIAFSARATADTSRRLTIVSGGSPAAAAINATLGAVTVRVTDQYLNPIANAPIVWNDSLSGGAMPTKTVDSTGIDGTTSSTWTLGGRPGTQIMRIREANSGARVTVTGTAFVQFADIAVGNFHVCAVSTTSRIYCWGLNDAGQLGKGTNRNTTAPTTAVSVSGDTSALANPMVVRQVTGSRSAVCAVTMAQDVYCWGHQWGSIETSTLPKLSTIKANAGAGGPLSLAYLAVAEDHGCLIQVSGISNCTGNNDIGQLGNVAAGPPFGSPSSGTWPYVDGQRPFSNIVLGTSFTCGFHRLGAETAPDSSQIPLCWGDGSMGQRGDSSTLNSIAAPKNASTPLHIKVKSLAAGIVFDSLSLAVGDKHACAVVAATSPAGAGDAYCWGANAYGQLGRDSTGTGNAARDSVAAKVKVTGGVSFVRLFAGKYHTCGLTATGVAYCWGRSDYGQLGNGVVLPFNTGTSTPVAVGGGLAFRNLSLGELFTCGVTGTPGTYVGPSPNPGTVYCWGDNSFGQVGNGLSSNGNVPVLAPTKVLYQP